MVGMLKLSEQCYSITTVLCDNADALLVSEESMHVSKTILILLKWGSNPLK
ncbi:uncharacterized protein G2W53_000403 [Senna tora]|uniref:Uncharacterized protein n=1 Tax=Senna tora TaxID=362788 RepID=A0A834XF99_9FABA|nr:uncharacterized protein G2W53_000403 [Senna tora]